MQRRSSAPLVLPLLGLCLGVLSGTLPSPCSAQSDISAVERHNNYDDFVREREARERKKEAEREEQAREAETAKKAEERAQRKRNGGKTDEELELENFGNRTLGGACMYGPDGNVIHRPSGARCQGDPAPRAGHEPSRPAPASLAPAQGSQHETIRRSTPKKERCIFVKGRVAFKPEGVDCYAR